MLCMWTNSLGPWPRPIGNEDFPNKATLTMWCLCIIFSVSFDSRSVRIVPGGEGGHYTWLTKARNKKLTTLAMLHSFCSTRVRIWRGPYKLCSAENYWCTTFASCEHRCTKCVFMPWPPKVKTGGIVFSPRTLCFHSVRPGIRKLFVSAW
jgi:hypothetical protein